MKTLRIITVLTATLFQQQLTGQETKTMPVESEDQKSVNHASRLKLQATMITSLAAQNQTLLDRVKALSQLLGVCQRKDSDAAARSKVDDVEQEILRDMNLTTGCKIQTDWSVVCLTDNTVQPIP